MSKKTLFDLSLDISESEYRQINALSYSTLAKFDRDGFSGLSRLFDHVSTPSLTFGSAVDAWITGGEEEFTSRFTVANFNTAADSTVRGIILSLYKEFKDIFPSLSDIPVEIKLKKLNESSFHLNWKDPTRLAKLDLGSDYYDFLSQCEGKTVLSDNEFYSVQNAVEALKTSDATSYYFGDNDDGRDRFYQLKFKTTLNGIEYKCMFDELICCHETKTIQPVDLKTSSHHEYEFYLSFKQWLYSHQSRLYSRILQDIISKDDYFKDFTILPYHFIVVNKFDLNPLVWVFKDSFKRGDLIYGKNKNIIIRDPEDIGAELTYYLQNNVSVPIGIKTNEPNDIIDFLNRI